MKLAFVKEATNAATKVVSKVGFKLKKASPELLLAGGIILMATATVVACVKTHKGAEDIIEGHRDAIAAVEEETHGNEKEEIRGKAKACINTGKEFVKLYYIPVGLELAGVAMVLGSHGIMKKRNAVLLATANLLEQKFAEYRERVKEELGEDRERLLNFNVEEREVAVQNEGETEPHTEKVQVVKDGLGYSPYARIFDEGNVNFKRNPNFNKFYLEKIQTYCNDYLQAHGHLFLNQVYEWLGFEHSPEGAVVGWLRNGTDGFVSFGMNDYWREKVKDFQNGYEPSIILDFNVDGVIWDKI